MIILISIADGLMSGWCHAGLCSVADWTMAVSLLISGLITIGFGFKVASQDGLEWWKVCFILMATAVVATIGWPMWALAGVAGVLFFGVLGAVLFGWKAAEWIIAKM